MKRFLALAAVMLLILPSMVVPVQAQSCTGWSNQLVPFAFESITVSTTPIGFTTATINPDNLTKAAYAFFTVETADGRYRVDGVDPTDAVGHVFDDAAPGYFVCGTVAVSQFRAIRSGGSNATLRVTYFKGA